MRIQGLQKLTLLDYPGQVVCTIFTSGCNFRCPFCHNASLVTHIDQNDALLEADVELFLKKRQGILDGVCISGGNLIGKGLTGLSKEKMKLVVETLKGKIPNVVVRGKI